VEQGGAGPAAKHCLGPDAAAALDVCHRLVVAACRWEVHCLSATDMAGGVGVQQAVSLDVPDMMQKIRSQSGMPAQVDDDLDADDAARPVKAETTADLAFRSFWGSDLAVVVGQKMSEDGRGSVQSEFMRLQRDSAMQSTSHLESLAAFAGVHSSVSSARGGVLLRTRPRT